MKPYVLAIDPGLATGMAFVKTDGEVMWTAETNWQETAKKTSDTLKEYGGENIDVVVEKYTITAATAKKSQQTWSLEIIGMVRMLAWVYGAGDITLQTPADAKNFASNPRLKSLGMWHVGGGGHALDALRHAVLRLVRLGWKDSRLLIEN